MGKTTGISWTDGTWNPIRGCTRVSRGCEHCYAESVAYRFSGAGQAYEGLVRIGADGERKPRWNGAIQFVEKHLLDPLRWKTPMRIFVNSMSDLFHENVTDAMRDRIFAVMALSPQHRFQVLTKRPERMRAYLAGPGRTARMELELELDFSLRPKARIAHVDAAFARVQAGPLPNVWLGVSVEDQEAADARMPLLLQTPAAVRFVSAEPLLGELNLHAFMCKHGTVGNHQQQFGNICDLAEPHVDLVICGGESGPGARPMHPDWARGLRDECVAAGVPFFFKQWGEWAVSGRENHLFSPDDSSALLGFTTVCSSELKNRGEVTFAALPKIGEDLDRVTGNKGWVEFERMRRVGKNAAGDLLDGRQWHEFPEGVR